MSASPELPDPPPTKDETPVAPELVGAGESHHSNPRPPKRSLTELEDEADENDVATAEGAASDDQPEDARDDGRERDQTPSGDEQPDERDDDDDDEDSGAVRFFSPTH